MHCECSYCRNAGRGPFDFHQGVRGGGILANAQERGADTRIECEPMATPLTDVHEPVGTIALTLRAAYQFTVDFGLDGVPPLATDATPPLGSGHGPDSERLLMAAVGNCLAASLAFSLRKFKNDAVGIKATVSAELARNEHGRLRVHGMAVDIVLDEVAAALRLLDRALAQYEDFCVVTQSVRAAIPVTVRVFDGAGVLLTPLK